MPPDQRQQSVVQRLIDENTDNVFRINEAEPGALMKHAITKCLNDRSSVDGVTQGPLLVHGDVLIAVFRIDPLCRFGPLKNGPNPTHISVLDGAKTLASAAAIQIGEKFVSRLTYDISATVQPYETYALRNLGSVATIDIVLLEASNQGEHSKGKESAAPPPPICTRNLRKKR
eukprot:Blabericola_migrator_1__8301@NODE_430_length_8568_cov_132_492766_g339_i0_p7_GENE_NODE_430_length_8568_cov_132_492766_g339_i0NODE_430_length_8568_cov_132_492766_g339_i0_p7_ORF_typecomplete_len173_score23_78_NODE_430_length_8568_cov_132_492766_g339_i060578